MQEELLFLEEQKVDNNLIRKVEDFRKEYMVSENAKERVTKPSIPFYGKRFWRWRSRRCCRDPICCCPGQRRQERIFWRKIWRGCLGGHPITSLLM